MPPRAQPFYDQNMQKMYEKILHAVQRVRARLGSPVLGVRLLRQEIKFPATMSAEAKSLLAGMLQVCVTCARGASIARFLRE